MSVSVWIKPFAELDSGDVTVITGRTAYSGAETYLFISTPYRIGWVSLASTPLVAYSANNSITPNNWNHVCVVWDGTTTAVNVKFYINGILSSHSFDQGSGTFNDNSAIPLTIGAFSSLTQGNFGGQISDVAIWQNLQLPEASVKILASSRQKGIAMNVGFVPSFYDSLDEIGDGVSASGTGKFVSKQGGFTGTPTGSPIGKAEEYLSYP